MKKLLIILIFFNIQLFALEGAKSSEDKIVEINKIFVKKNAILDDFEIKKLLSDDLISVLLPYELPFVDFKIPKKNLDKCNTIINEFLFNKGYFNNKVECRYNRTTTNLNVDINFGDLFIVDKIKFNSDYLKISSACERKDICLKKGDIASDENLNKIKEVISKELENNGYILNEVVIERTNQHNGNLIDINFDVKQNLLCYFGDITVNYEGNIDNNLIRNFLRFKKGDIFNFQKIKHSIDNLKSKKIFENVVVSPDFNNISQGVFPINISLKEKEKYKEIKIGLGYDSYEGVKFSSSWTNYKFLNDLKRLNLNLDISKKIEEVSINFDNPFIIPEYKINLFNTFEYIKDNTDSKNSQSFNNNLYLNRNFGDIKAYIGYKTTLVNDFSNLIDFDLTDDIVVHSIYQTFAIEDVDNILFPTKGYKFEATIENSIISEDFDFLEFNGGVKGYGVLSDKYKTYISGRIFFDNIKSNTPILNYKKPVSGGYNSNRGFEFQSLDVDGNPTSIVLTELGVELKQKVHKDLYLYLFDDYTKINTQTYNSFGFGLYYNSPLGTFSVGNAYNSDDDYKVFFNIGVSF